MAFAPKLFVASRKREIDKLIVSLIERIIAPGVGRMEGLNNEFSFGLVHLVGPI